MKTLFAIIVSVILLLNENAYSQTLMVPVWGRSVYVLDWQTGTYKVVIQTSQRWRFGYRRMFFQFNPQQQRQQSNGPISYRQ